MTNELDEVARLIVAELSPEAVRHGWHVQRLRVSAYDDCIVWEVDVCGPRDLMVDEHHFSGQREPVWTWRVETGVHGTLSALTPGALVAEVRKWLAVVGQAAPGEVDANRDSNRA